MKNLILKNKKFSLLHYKIILKKFKLKKKIFDADINQSIIEDITGNLSSSIFIGIFTATGGSVALFAHPIVGTTILFFSIVYGSVIKVFAGKYYRKRCKIKNDFSYKELSELIKSKKKVITFMKSDTSDYAFVRISPPKNSKYVLPSSPIINETFMPSSSNRVILTPINNKKIVPL